MCRLQSPVVTLLCHSVIFVKIEHKMRYNNSVLNTTEGSAALEAIYTPNTIGTTWYSDGVQLEVDNSATSCTYDTAMTLPTNPTKAGYEFNGWKIRVLPCLIPSTLVSTQGVANGEYPLNGGNYVAHNNIPLATYEISEPGEWGVTWNSGDKVTGVAFCSTTNDGKSYYQTGNPGTTGGGTYCWCKATHYTPSGNSRCALSSPVWVLYRSQSDANCATYCAARCSSEVSAYQNFKTALFGDNVAQ